MNLIIKYFGMLAEATKKPEEVMDVEQHLRLDELRTKLEYKYPSLKNKNYQLAVNQSIGEQNISLSANDEIALLPPYSGG